MAPADTTEADLSGVYPIIATPFTEDDAVDYDSLENEIHVMAEQGCHGGTLFGLASEFYKLSDAERAEMVDVVTDAAEEAGLSLVISVTHESTRVAVDWARQYEAAGADCLMVFTPVFKNPPADGVLDHLGQIGEAVDIPIMVQHTELSASVSPDSFLDLHRRVPNIRYFKLEINPPGPYISTLLEDEEADVDVLVGSAGRPMIEAYDRGAVGVMPAAIYNELYVAIHEALVAGDRDRAIELHTPLLGVLNNVNGVLSEKQLLARRGIIETDRCREPTVDTVDETSREILDEYHEELMAIIDDL